MTGWSGVNRTAPSLVITSTVSQVFRDETAATVVSLRNPWWSVHKRSPRWTRRAGFAPPTALTTCLLGTHSEKKSMSFTTTISSYSSTKRASFRTSWAFMR